MPNVRSFCSMLTCKSHRSVDVKPTESTGNEKSTLEADSENSKIKLIPHSQIALPRQEFSEKVVLITGSSDGIGAETIKYFAHCGSQVVVTGRNEEKIARVALECDTVSPNSYRALQIIADVTQTSDCKRLVESTVNHFGRIDILINNAGEAKSSSLYDPHLMDSLEEMININLRSAIQITQFAAPYLEMTNGSIIYVTSSVSKKPFTPTTTYCVAKAALEMFTKCMALELGSKGIRVNSVVPTAVSGASFFVSGEKAKEEIQKLEQANPLGRIATKDDVVNAISFLSSSSASFINGNSTMVDGASRHL